MTGAILLRPFNPVSSLRSPFPLLPPLRSAPPHQPIPPPPSSNQITPPLASRPRTPPPRVSLGGRGGGVGAARARRRERGTEGRGAAAGDERGAERETRRRRQRSGRRRPGLPNQNKNTAVAFHHPIYIRTIIPIDRSIPRNPRRERERARGLVERRERERSRLRNPVLANKTKKNHTERARKKAAAHTQQPNNKQQHDDDDDDDDPGPPVSARATARSAALGAQAHTRRFFVLPPRAPPRPGTPGVLLSLAPLELKTTNKQGPPLFLSPFRCAGGVGGGSPPNSQQQNRTVAACTLAGQPRRAARGGNTQNREGPTMREACACGARRARGYARGGQTAPFLAQPTQPLSCAAPRWCAFSLPPSDPARARAQLPPRRCANALRTKPSCLVCVCLFSPPARFLCCSPRSTPKPLGTKKNPTVARPPLSSKGGPRPSVVCPPNPLFLHDPAPRLAPLLPVFGGPGRAREMRARRWPCSSSCAGVLSLVLDSFGA